MEIPQEIEKLEDQLRRVNAANLEVLDKAKRYREQNLLEFFDREPGPNPKQKLLLDAWNNPKFKVFTFTGGNRMGKTTIGTVISFSVMFGYWPWSGQRIDFPHARPRRVRLIGQDWEKHIKTVIEPSLEKWWPKARILKTSKNNVGAKAMWIDKETGSTLELMSNHQDSDMFEGWDGDLVYYDEPCQRDIRVANARGLVDRLGRELFCMTLLKEAWIDQEVIRARLEDGRPDLSVFNVTGTIYDNVGYGITNEGVAQFKKTLKPEEEQARLWGVPSYMSGLVYKEFNRQAHLTERFKIPSDWMVDIAIDIHPRKEQAVLFVATDPRNDRYAFWEIWEHGDGEYIAGEIVRVIKYYNLRANRFVIDPLSKGDKNMPNTTFDNIAMVLSRYGYVLEVATKDKQSGIIKVRNHLMGPNKRPSLFFFSDMNRSIFEIEGYMYDKDTQKPQKENDDMMENLYRLCLLDSQYIDPDELEDEAGEYAHDTVDSMTGY